jgi:hypothetical protein
MGQREGHTPSAGEGSSDYGGNREKKLDHNDFLVRIIGSGRHDGPLVRLLLLKLPPAPGEEFPLPLTLDLDQQKEILKNRFRLIPTKEAEEIHFRCYIEARREVKANDLILKWRNDYFKQAVISFAILGLMGASYYYNWPGDKERQIRSGENSGEKAFQSSFRGRLAGKNVHSFWFGLIKHPIQTMARVTIVGFLATGVITLFEAASVTFWGNGPLKFTWRKCPQVYSGVLSFIAFYGILRIIGGIIKD